MSLEAIKQVTETEQSIQTRRAAAEAEARQITADAEKAGQALVKQARTEAAEQGKHCSGRLRNGRQSGRRRSRRRRKRRANASASRQRRVWKRLPSLS